MRKLFVLLVALCLVQTASAALGFMKKPYELLDKVVMPVWKPLINIILISWAQNIVCDRFVDVVLEAIDAKNEMSEEESKTFCTEGIKSFVEGFFYGGSIDDKPSSYGWSWNPAMDFA